MKQIWKFLYWPVIWIITLIPPYTYYGDKLLIEGPPGLISIILGIILFFYSIILTSIGGRTLKLYGHSSNTFWPDKLVTTGIYSCMRHPQHLGLMLFPVSLSLLTKSIPVVLSSGWAALGAILFVILIEEPECLRKYGENYTRYMMEVPAFNLNPRCLKRGLEALKKGNINKTQIE